MLGLGINVPLTDTKTAEVTSANKEEVKEKYGAVTVDTIQGLSVFPDDGKHVEYVMGGTGDVYPSDPEYVLEALRKIWSLDMTLDQSAEDALNIFGIAEGETSARAKFLITYLALEPLIQTDSRSQAAVALIAEFQQRVAQAGLGDEGESLISPLGNLREQSFPGALRKFAARINPPIEPKGRPHLAFLSQCIDARNKIAHRAAIDASVNLDELSAGLRQFVLMIIWTNNGIPSLSIDVPASQISIPEFAIRIL
jgi:hypothetical protein